MKKSIIRRILTVFLTLTVIFMMNTIAGCITNDQVALSAKLMSHLFIPLNQERMILFEGQRSINELKTLLNDEKASLTSEEQEEFRHRMNTQVAFVEEAILRMDTLSILATELIMTSDIEDAYASYRSDLKTYIQGINDASLDMIQTNQLYELVKSSEQNFSQIVRDSQDHETKLIDSRVARSTFILWVAGLLFLLSAIIGFISIRRSLARPLRNTSGELQRITDSIESEQGDLSFRFQGVKQDEIGQIMDSMNRFLSIMEHTVSAIKNGALTINQSIESTSDAVMSSNDSLNSISSVMSELSAGMEQITATIQAMDSDAHMVYELSSQIATTATDNGQLMDQLAIIECIHRGCKSRCGRKRFCSGSRRDKAPVSKHP